MRYARIRLTENPNQCSLALDDVHVCVAHVGGYKLQMYNRVDVSSVFVAYTLYVF